jgi:hypothetical protein
MTVPKDSNSEHQICVRDHFFRKHILRLKLSFIIGVFSLTICFGKTVQVTLILVYIRTYIQKT